MDVRCPSCGTDYELDDARVPDTGLPVKCSKCGHIFRAMRPVDPSPGEPARVVTGVHSIAPEWIIRRTSGEMVRFRELTTLQRWIVERKVGRTDEISKTGKKWEKLGNIPELAVFFQVVDGQSAPPPSMALPPSMTPPPPPPMTNPGMPSYPVAQAQAAAAVAYRTGPDPLSETLPDPSSRNRILTTERQSPLRVEPQEHRHETVRWDMSSELPDDLREEYEKREFSGIRPGRDELMPRRFSPVQMMLGGFVVVAALLALTYAAKPSLLKGLYRRYVSGTPAEAVRDVASGYESLDRDTVVRLDQAVGMFEAAVRLDESYAPAHAGLAEALVARVDELRDEADRDAATLTTHPVAQSAEPLAAIADKRKRADADMERAKQEAGTAVELDDTSFTSIRALLDVVRFSGDSARQDALAMKAHAMSPDDARLTMIMGEIAIRDPAASDRASEQLEAAVKANPKLVHAEYALALLYAKAGKKDKALAIIDRVLNEVPDHARLVALRGELREEEAKPNAEKPTAEKPTAEQPTTEKPTAEQPTAEQPTAEKPTAEKPTAEKPNAEKPNAEKPTADAAAAKPGPRAADDPTITFAEALARGERLRDQDKPGQALRYYERAAQLQPSDPDGHLGVGFCNLDLRQSTAAIAAFKKALELSPRFSDAHFGLAEAFRIRGNKLYAIRYYKSYLDIAPRGADADVARTQLDRLEDDNTAVTPADLRPQQSQQTPEPPPSPAPPGGSP